MYLTPLLCTSLNVLLASWQFPRPTPIRQPHCDPNERGILRSVRCETLLGTLRGKFPRARSNKGKQNGKRPKSCSAKQYRCPPPVLHKTYTFVRHPEITKPVTRSNNFGKYKMGKFVFQRPTTTKNPRSTPRHYGPNG